MAGSKLVFFDLEGSSIDGPSTVVQVICNQSVVKEPAEGTKQPERNPEDDHSVVPSDVIDSIGPEPLNMDATMDVVNDERFKSACQMIRVGDWIGTRCPSCPLRSSALTTFSAVRGHPHSTRKGQLSLLATELPTLHAPQLHQLPEGATDMENVTRRAHVKMLMQPRIRDIFRLRMLIEDRLDFSCKSRGLTRVRTPILGTSSGGTNADAFETNAKELSGERLSLRIAPELYLKRLMVGDMVGVYEIGPAFRNEGIDATHNPEFTICEYYQRYVKLNRLISETEELFAKLYAQVHAWRRNYNIDLSVPNLKVDLPFRRLDFVSTLSRRLQHALSDTSFNLPNLEQQDAVESLRELYPRLKIPLPSYPTLPRVLDDLSGRYLESLCVDPTWIHRQPACLAPLAKSFIDEASGQHVSARAELFIGRREYVNCYEEENNPFEQRRKFLQQREFQKQEQTSEGATEAAEAEERPSGLLGIEESYIEALEWGLPPTGGWGCGVDRLVMLFAGVDRIADVLPFGTLRNVAAMGKPLR